MHSKEQREELHKMIWKIANELRGKVDGWDFKIYVLGFLFYRFISENFRDYATSRLQNKNYAKLSDEQAEYAKDALIKEKGFYIAPSELFENINVNDENLNEKLRSVFDTIEGSAIGTQSEEDFKGLFADIDTNSPKLGGTLKERNARLKEIIDKMKELEQLTYNNNSIDAFGDAYEYLIAMYASSAGKSGGEFFTPQEVAKLLALITLENCKNPNKVYDPACGSGSLLLQFKKLGKLPSGGFYGQEVNLTSYNLARMNMILHDIGYENFSIAYGDTLLEPKHFDDEPFDAIVSNPPYSTKWIGDDDKTLINDSRYAPAGILAPKSKADYAFIMHSLAWLSEKGSAAIVVFPGILYRMGAEGTIRKWLITQNYIDCIIALPENLFFGVSIATCIMVLKKNKVDDKILFINAKDEFIKAKNKNQLSEQNIQNLITLYKNRDSIEYKSALATMEQVSANDYNLSVSSYIESKDTKEIINITELNVEIVNIVERQSKLRKEIDTIIASLEGA